MTHKSSWVRSAPVISTTHAPGISAINALKEEGRLMADYGEGLFLYIGDRASLEENEFPKWLEAVCLWAWEFHGEDNGWICLDCDGVQIEGLATYSGSWDESAAGVAK